MSTSQAVFLFDICAFSESESPEQLQNALKCLRRVCLRLIILLSERISSFRFGFKFFDSKGTVTQISDRFPFSEVNLEAFENLEIEISRRYQRYATQCKVVAQSVNSAATDINNQRILTLFGNEHNLPVKVLNLILTQTLCEFQWESLEISSPVRNHKGRISQNFVKKYVFLISSPPINESSPIKYFGVKDTSNVDTVKQLLMPPALYKKFVVETNISLVWLDTTRLSFTNDLKADNFSSAEVFKSAINGLCGALIPLQVLAENNLFYSKDLLEVSNVTDKKSTKLSIPAGAENLLLQKKSSFFLPFSSLFSHYISGNHISQSSLSENYCSLLFPNKLSVEVQLLPATTYPVSHLSVCNKVNTSSPGPKRSRRSCVGKKNVCESNVKWCNFVCNHTVPRGFYGNPDSTFICLPALKKSSEEQYTILKEVNKILLSKNQNLVLKCETKAGFSGVGIFTPLSEASATISVFSSTPVLFSEKIAVHSTKQVHDIHNFVNKKKGKLLKCLENFNTETALDSLENCATYKIFDMTSVERWFMPTSKVSDVFAEMKEKCVKIKKPSTSDFLLKLQHHYKANKSATPRKKLNPEGLAKLKTGGKDNHPLNKQFSQDSEDTEISQFDFKDEDDVRKHLQKMYDSAVLLEEPILHSAQSLINVAMDFFRAKESEKNSSDISTFMNKHILAATCELSQKYNDKSDTADIRMKIREYQLQVVLHLELVALLPLSIDGCVNKVTALLRTLSFVIGPFELSQFLQDTVVGNYSGNLHHVLVEIGEELNMPIIPDLLSPSSISDAESPERVAKSSTLSQNSIPSWRSTSSSNQRSIKSSSLTRRSLSGKFKINQNRQIMVPTRLLRKHKASGKNEPQPVRKSPRLATKSNIRDSNPYTNMKASRICRNLFSVKPKKRCKSISPEKGNCKRRKLLTPKGHHTLKTNYVPETPSPKQGSSFQRRVARLSEKIGTVSEIMESPVSTLDKGAHISRMNMLRKNGSFYDIPSSEYGSNKEHSRSIFLSNDDDKPKIKPSYLFSEILGSPSTDHPSRRCSKRLFQNYTPPKTYSSSPKAQQSPPKTPENQPSTSKSFPETQLGTLKDFPSTPLKSILKHTPSKEIKSCSLVKDFSSPISTVVLSLPMHAFPTPDKSISPICDSEDVTIKTTEMTEQSIRNVSGQCSSSINSTNAFVDVSFLSKKQNIHIIRVKNTESQSNRRDYNQTDTFLDKPFQPFSSLGKKAISKTSVPRAMDKHVSNQFKKTSPLLFSQRLRSGKGALPSQPNFVSENARLPADISFSDKANDSITVKKDRLEEDTTQITVPEMECRVKKAFTNYIESPKKASKSVSFGFAPVANCKDSEPPCQFKDLGNVYSPHAPPNTITSPFSAHTPSKNKKLYTSPTTSSLLHLSTSPVVFTKKTQKS